MLQHNVADIGNNSLFVILELLPDKYCPSKSSASTTVSNHEIECTNMKLDFLRS